MHLSDKDRTQIKSEAEARLTSLLDELKTCTPGTWHYEEVRRAISNTEETLNLLTQTTD